MAINETVTGPNSVAITGTATGDNSLGVAGKAGGTGVKGEGGGTGVWGHGKTWMGVYGFSESTTGGHGVMGEAVGTGVVGVGKTWLGVYGETHAAATAGAAGVWGDGKEGGDGVKGIATAVGKAAVCGFHVGTVGEGGPAVFGDSKAGRGVQGQGQVGVLGIGRAWIGVYGETLAQASAGSAGVWGDGKDAGDGVKGVAKGAGKAAVCGFQLGNNGPGIFGQGAPAGHFQGDVRITNNLVVDGDITLTNADCAEEFDVADAASVEAGTVMVLGDDGRLHPSLHAYDKRVAGVVSGAGDFRPGLVLDKQRSSSERRPIALLGKVYCKADARHAAIRIGDLLTTSDRPGHAMKATDPPKAFGAIIGKALRPLEAGQGLIPVLIALQ